MTILFPLVALLAVGEGRPLRVFDCAVVDASHAKSTFSVVVDDRDNPLFVQDGAASGPGKVAFLQRIDKYVPSRLHTELAGRDRVVTLSLRSKTTPSAGVLVEDDLSAEWPHRRMVASGSCALRPSSAAISDVRMPSKYRDEYTIAFASVRFVDETKKRVPASWESTCWAVAPDGKTSDLRIAVNLSNKTLDRAARSPATLDVVSPGSAQAVRYVGDFGLYLEQEWRKPRTEVVTLSVTAYRPGEKDNPSFLLKLRDNGSDLSQHIYSISDGGEAITSGGVCNSVRLPEVFGKDSIQ